MQKTYLRGNHRLTIDSSGMEYGRWKVGESFPVSACICHLSYFLNGNFDFHWHEGPELTIIIKGQMEYQVNDNQYRMKEGDCIFVNSGVMHAGRLGGEEDCEYLVVSFLTSAIDGAKNGVFAERFSGGAIDAKAVPFMLFEAGNDDVANICHTIYEEMAEKADCWELGVKGHLCHLWQRLYKAAMKQTPVWQDRLVPMKRIKNAIQYMNENYASTLTLKDIAAACNLGKSEFCDCFKKITRQTAFDYLLELRVRKSLQFLDSDGGLSITEIAQNSGFSNSSYYAKIFRRYMGCTPREYLRMKKNRE